MSKKGAGSSSTGKEENIKVVIRCRPLSKDEVRDQRKKIVDMDRISREVRVRNPSSWSDAPRVFTMDHVFPEELSQETVYKETCLPIVENVIQGYNGTVFAYGQTGTGKTFTMEGVDKPPELKGMLPRAFAQIFEHIDACTTGAQFLVRASFLEIYNDNVLDLLAENASSSSSGGQSTHGHAGLELKEDPEKGVYVKDLRLVTVKNVQEINALAVLGRKSRKVGSTLMNRDSSRSHCLFCIMIETSEIGADGEAHIHAGKLNMVDLAGSEKQTKTGAEGERLKEAAKINLALSALGNVISALTSQKVGHVPYRDSKLTRLLQDSLGGNTKTVMIANVGPADYNYDETIGTLRFATRAKSIKNKPKINEDPKDAKLREYQDEIAKLKALIAAEEAIAQGLPPPDGYDPNIAASMGLRPSSGLKPLPPRVVKKEVTKTVLVGIRPEEVTRVKAEAEALRKSLEEKQKAQAEEQRQLKLILENKKTAVMSEMAETEEEISKKRVNRLALRDRLMEIEKGIVQTTKSVEEGKRNEMAIREKQHLMEQARLEAERAQEARREIEDEAAFLANQYGDLDKEFAAKKNKFEKLSTKYSQLKQEAEDIQAENQREREQLLETIRELTRHIQLKDFILENFVPREETEKVENRAYWSEDDDQWMLHPTDYQQLNYGIKRPGSAKANLRRPTTDFALAHAMDGADGGPRFKAENILELELDMLERTTQDYHAAAGSGSGAADPYDDAAPSAAEVAYHEQQLAMQQQQQQMEAAMGMGMRGINSGMAAYMDQQQQMRMQQQQYRR